MSVLKKGMEMPKLGFIEIPIRDDGTVQQIGQSYRIDGTDYYTPYWTDDFYETEYVEVEDMDAAPTVIEAEET